MLLQAEERELLVQTALREHSSAVAELAAVLEGTPAEGAPAEGTGLAEAASPTEDASLAEAAQDAAAQQDAGAAAETAVDAAAAAPVIAAPEAPVDPVTAAAGAAALEAAPSRTGSGMLAKPSAGALGAVGAASAASSALSSPAGTPKRQRERWQQPQADGQGRAPGEGPGLVAPRLLPPVKTVHSQPGSARTWHTQAMVLGEEDEDEEHGTTQRAAPLSVVLEMSVMRSVVSQYRAVSRACVRWVK